MARINYQYNTSKMRFERVEVSVKAQLTRAFGFLSTALVFSFLLTVLAYNYLDSPKEKKLRREISVLKQQYEVIGDKLGFAEAALSDLQNRDNNIYRVIYEAEPIGAAERRAGVAGRSYRKLAGYDNSEIMLQTSVRLDRIVRQMYVQSKSYDEVSKLVKANSNMLASIPAIQPIANNDLKRVASGFGFRVHPIYKTRKMHTGMDFTASIGTEIYATGDGVVKEIKNDGGYGNHVVITHGYGYQTLYAHMSRFGVRAGQKVKRGDIVGYVGNTGRSTGPHLHYEVIKGNAKINPVNFYYNDLTPADYERMAELAETANQSFD